MGLVLATFNVLDLFDASDAERIERLAALLRPHQPDVVALQEVGGAEATNAFARALGGDWDTVLGDADDRGIACALLSRSRAGHRIVTRDVLRAAELPFPRFRREDPEPFASRIPLRRSIPDVVIDQEGFGRLRVLVVHFKSRRGKPMQGETLETTAHLAEAETRAVVWRCAEALFVRRAVDEHLARDASECLCVCGDFNDVPGSLPLRIVAGTAGVEDGTRPDALVSCVETIAAAERFSVDHGGNPAAIDHALVSPSLAARFSRAFYVRAGGEKPRRAGEPSDHAPLIVHFS